MSVKLSAKVFAFRRWFADALATRSPLSTRAKIITALVIFTVSYVTKTLQAVDLAPVMYTIQQPLGGLSDTYDLRAASILKGEGLLGPYNIHPSRTVWVAQAPGYSIFLSFVYRMTGRDFFRVQMVQNAVNSVSPVLIFLIAGLVVSWRVGQVSGVMAALSHHFSHISNFILPDSLSALPLLAALCLITVADRLRRRAALKHVYLLYAAAGVMFAAAAWLRSQTMLIGLFLIPALALISTRRWTALKRATVAAVVSILCIAPVTIKNYVVYGEFIPINIGMGIVLWEGIAEASNYGFGTVAKDEEVAAQDAVIYNNPRYGGTWSSPDGVMRDRDRVRKSLEIIRNNPAWYAGVMVDRMREMFKYSANAPLVYKPSQVSGRAPAHPIKKGWEDRVSDGYVLRFGESLFWLRPLLRFFQRAMKETLQPFIVVGMAMMMAAGLRRALFLLAVPIYYLLFQSFMHTEFRYTLPMHYFIFVFAAITWTALGRVLLNGARRLRRNLRRVPTSDAQAPPPKL